MKNFNQYPYLERFSRWIGIPADNLVKAFEIEKKFHNAILKESNREKRKKMYQQVYEEVHQIYLKKPALKDQNALQKNPKDRVVRLFRKELAHKSILDVGCGQGHFLLSVHRQLPHKRLVGIDISTPVLPQKVEGVEFIKANIIDFQVSDKFDVVFSDQVMEHIAPADLPRHLKSVRNALKDEGTFIIIMPNRLFGPGDVTRIIDCSYTNRVQAMGTHLNESAYSEMIPILRYHGFTHFRTVFPLHYIRYWFYWLRLNPQLLVAIEQRPWILNLIYKVRFRSQCIARFDTTLICRVSQS